MIFVVRLSQKLTKMNLEFVLLLQLQRDLYDVPRGEERFQTYIQTITNADASDIELPPLAAMNPMGKEHVPEMLDTLLALDADEIASDVVTEVSQKLLNQPGEFKIGLVVADDLLGGWTNRYTTEFNTRFNNQAILKRGWLSCTLWTSETPSVQIVREEVLTTVYRAAYIQNHGFPKTLEDMLNQEGYAMAMSDCTEPSLKADDLVYTKEVITPHLTTQEQPIIIPCLFGDKAAESLGYKPQGLSERAGFALALALHNKS